MTEKRRLEPGPDHTITVEPTGHLVSAMVHGRRVAASEDTLTLREAGYEPVIYFPPGDVDPDVSRESSSLSYCPYKGDAGYVDIVVPTGPVGDGRGDSADAITDAGWFYATPYEPVAAIAGYIAFYPDRVQVVEHAPGGDLDWTDRSVRSPDAYHA
jgi:uncharacterized protein (DUF427 family)